MESSRRSYCAFRELFLVLTFLLSFSSPCFSSSLLRSVAKSVKEHQDHTFFSDFQLVTRRLLTDCPDPNPYLQIHVSPDSDLPDVVNVTVTVSGVLVPEETDWVAMISPISTDVSKCPLDEVMYLETGDLSKLPLLCHYPVKAQYMSKDPDYINCTKKECKQYENGSCVKTTCSGSVMFNVINIRTEIEFVFFAGGFDLPCVLKRSKPVNFANPKQPLYGHLSSIDSTGTSMRITWISGDKAPQQVLYGNGKTQTSKVSTFSQHDMPDLSPAKDFGWHDPGFIHSAVMTGLQPSSVFSYRYGSDSAGWSDRILFKTPPARGSDEVHFIAYGDMGKAPRDDSVEHYINPGSLFVDAALKDEVNSGNVDSIFHMGDISYATGFLAEWDFFLQLITPFASRVTYMTAIGNHERDYPDSGSVYITPDSGGECGVAYETYFPMPIQAKDKPWYSIEQAGVHFTIISTENDWSENSEQYEWMKKDMASVDRSITPWLIFMGHRPMYTSADGLLNVDANFVHAIEPLLLDYKVDLALFGHVHNYERTCTVYQEKCRAMPTRDEFGIDTYHNTNYSAPVQAIIGMGGFTLDNFKTDVPEWSLCRISKFGYIRAHATREEINVEMKLTWVSGDEAPQQVQYSGKTVTSEVATFSQADMCSEFLKIRFLFSFDPKHKDLRQDVLSLYIYRIRKSLGLYECYFLLELFFLDYIKFIFSTILVKIMWKGSYLLQPVANIVHFDSLLPSPAKDFGWLDPGFIHSAVMTGLAPSSTFSYRYGSDLAGWSEQIQFRTPPAGGSDELKFLAFGDMGKAPRNAAVEHYIQPGSLSVTKAMADEVDSNKIDSIFHIGEISYATGFLVEWDLFLQQISAVASRVPYMTAIGNHERDYIKSGSLYINPNSRGECGVPYETYFPMPTSAKDKPWYSIEQASVHFIVISTKHSWFPNSEQWHMF